MNTIIENFIKYLSDEYRQEVLFLIKEKDPKNKSELNSLLSEFRKNKGFVKVGRSTEKYWIQRGWSREESLELKKNYKVNNFPHGTPMQTKYWLDRINPMTGEKYTIEEAKYKIRSHRIFNKEYWIERGFSEDESIKKAKEEQDKNAEKARNKTLENPDFYKNRTWNQTGYWIKKGMTEIEAREKVSQLQDKNSLNSLMNKWGNIEGMKRYENILKNLSFSSSIEGYRERYGELGEIKYAEHIAKKTYKICSVSRESLLFFIPIYKKIRKFLQKDEIFWGIDGSKEYFLWDDELKKIFFYDFVIPRYKIIIEFHGTYWHPNPSWSEEKWKKWKCLGVDANEKRKSDEYKMRLAQNKGFRVIEIFSDEKEIFNMDAIIDIIKS